METEQKKTLRIEAIQVRSVVFSPDGRTLAIVNYQKPPTLWNLAGEKEWKIAGLPVATALTFSADGQTLAVAVAEGPIQLWDLADGKLRKTLAHPFSRGFLAFSADGRRLLSGDLRLWDVASGQCLWQGNSPGASPVAALAADGRHVAVPYVFAGFIFRIPAKLGGR
jgi:WD40 repeat protein